MPKHSLFFYAHIFALNHGLKALLKRYLTIYTSIREYFDMPNTSIGSKQFDPEDRLHTFLGCVSGILARQWLEDQRPQDFQPMRATNDKPDRHQDSDRSVLSDHVAATCDASATPSP